MAGRRYVLQDVTTNTLVLVDELGKVGGVLLPLSECDAGVVGCGVRDGPLVPYVMLLLLVFWAWLCCSAGPGQTN